MMEVTLWIEPGVYGEYNRVSVCNDTIRLSLHSAQDIMLVRLPLH